jgi:hypothetical protein
MNAHGLLTQLFSRRGPSPGLSRSTPLDFSIPSGPAACPANLLGDTR